MLFKETILKGAFVIEPERLEDNRGFFASVWSKREFEKNNLNANMVQGNISFNNSRGTLRGLHYQAFPHEEAKLVRCTAGEIYDVIIDLRPASPTYKQWLGVELSAASHTLLYVPEGFAHGYQALTDKAEVFYQVSQFYRPESERGVRWNDPAFGIQWKNTEKLVISDKDRKWPDF